MGKSRNRNMGFKTERDFMHDMQAFFPECKTSRNESRTLDAKKVDLTSTDPFAFQIKLSSKRLNYDNILEEMDTDQMKVILNKMAIKPRKGKRFMQRGKFAILYYDDFLKLLSSYLCKCRIK